MARIDYRSSYDWTGEETRRRNRLKVAMRIGAAIIGAGAVLWSMSHLLAWFVVQ